MNPLRYEIVDKLPGFKSEMIHIRDNCFVMIDSQFINIVFEHDDSLECHGFSRSAITKYAMKCILDEPVLNAIDENMVRLMSETVSNRTIKEASCCTELRSKCKSWRDNHYVRRVYNGFRSSIYAFTYKIADSNPIVCLQAVNYGGMNMKGSFSIDRDIIENIYSRI